MSQITHPGSDISSDANWVSTPYWSKLDELSPDDSDFVSCVVVNKSFEVGLLPMDTPVSSVNQIINVRAKLNGLHLRVRLKQGATVIKENVIHGTNDYSNPFENFQLFLTNDEIAAITDYTNLSIQCITVSLLT